MANNTEQSNFKYCNSLTSYSRYKTRVVNIGDVPLGGDNPIRIQSMTNINTMDTMGNVEQAIRLVNAGCEYVRITAPGIKEAKNLALIKKELKKRGYDVPIIADIHFNHRAAEVAARIVEKVRINPGNYVDRKIKDKTTYTDKEYNLEIEKIYDRILPLIKICKQYGTAIRIGSNQGSLSDRIMSRFGDTSLGMVVAAMEFVDIFRDLNYHDIVLSMKSSNTRIMVQSNRLLVHKMISQNLNYPIHLGVTEAGIGTAGRIKSSVGIGALLADGIGDTVRVSLTEDPVNEIPVAKKIVNHYFYDNQKPKPEKIISSFVNPFKYQKRKSFKINNIGANNVPVVIADFSNVHNKYLLSDSEFENTLFKKGFFKDKNNKWKKNNLGCDYFYASDIKINYEVPSDLYIIQNINSWQKNKSNFFPLFTADEYLNAKEKSDKQNFVIVFYDELNTAFINKIKDDNTVILVFETKSQFGTLEQRKMFFELANNDCNVPVIIKRNYKNIDYKNLMVNSAADFGVLFIDGFGDGIWILTDERINTTIINEISFEILQACRLRFSKTEYISCPSCGRTQFNIQETLMKIRKHTQHLKGITIGVMGCIVNGPGEMIEADYGYVGSGKGKITLFKANEIVKKNIDEKYAVDELINIIKENGDWVEKI